MKKPNIMLQGKEKVCIFPLYKNLKLFFLFFPRHAGGFFWRLVSPWLW